MAESRRSPGFYGAKVEEYVLNKYDLERSYEPVRGVRFDAVDDDGKPVEIKAVARNRDGGRENMVQFKIWDDQHVALSRERGYYVFVEYYMTSSGIRVIRSRSIGANSLWIQGGWYETDSRGDALQNEVPAELVFDDF